MSWVPPNMADVCQAHDTTSACAPPAILFLALIAKVFSGSQDVRGYSRTPASIGSGEDYARGYGWTPASTGSGEDHARGYGWTPASVQPQKDDAVYDFIIVGGGSAGCVLANRLSEVKHWRVLLLEAGIEEPEVAEIPAMAPLLQRSNIDWGYRTMPQKRACTARREGRCGWARGKVLGGSSSINYMIYVRGNRQDYDNWAAAGNDGWSYDDVLPYFKKSENNEDLNDVAFHQRGGYQTVEWFPYQDVNTRLLLDSWMEMGYKEVDPNAESQLGVTHHQTTSKHGERQSTNSAFVRPVRRKRPNLTVVTQAQVSRLLIDADKRVLGVEYLKDGRIATATSKKEVILSAGAINSPKILMCSGIGPKFDLARNGIKLVKDLPVGFNLQDHVTTDGVMFTLGKTATNTTDQQKLADIIYYQLKKKGPLSAIGSLQVGAFVQTEYENRPDLPDIQFSFDATNVADFLADPANAGAKANGPLAYYDGITIRPILLSPNSRGRVRLNLTDPVWGDPYIYPGYFTENPDADVLVAGIKLGLRMLETKAMKLAGAAVVDVPLEHCKQHTFGTDEYWHCVIRQYTGTIFHPVGTCKMGPASNPTTVVDDHLKVHGVQRLRVIDASVMPKVVRGNTNAPTIMIAERGADLIKSDWLLWEPIAEFESSLNFIV